MNCKRKLRRRSFLLMRSRTPPISSEFRGGGFKHPKLPPSVSHWRLGLPSGLFPYHTHIITPRVAKAMTCEVQLIICYHPNNNFWVVKLTKLFFMQFSLFSSQLLPPIALFSFVLCLCISLNAWFSNPWPVRFYLAACGHNCKLWICYTHYARIKTLMYITRRAVHETARNNGCGPSP